MITLSKKSFRTLLSFLLVLISLSIPSRQMAPVASSQVEIEQTIPAWLMSTFLAASSQPLNAGADLERNPLADQPYTSDEANTIYQLIFPEQKVTASDGAASDQFGYSVALSGDTALVGAFLHDVGAHSQQGAAYIFTRSGATWTQQAQLTAADGATEDWFGYSVALSGDTALVGAIFDDVDTNIRQGSAYVFTRSGATWTQQAQLTAADGAADDGFGRSVALSGETALVGAAGDFVPGGTEQGSAYVFTRSGETWTQQAQLIASDGAASDTFGISVVLSADTALVGAHRHDVGANSDQGSAYVFTRNGATWTQQAQLTAADGAANDYFGYSVALSGETALVGAQHDVGTNSDQGSAYVFTRSGTTWTQQAQLTASDGAERDYFGSSVVLSGDTALVGANEDDIGAKENQGSAYIFIRSGATWTQLTQLTASDGAAADNFGYSVALSGDTALVGAFYDDVGANSEQGSAYFYDLLPSVLSSVRADPNPTNAASVNFIVTFSEAVIGVGANDFSLFTTGSISGASVIGMSGSVAIYNVSVNTGVGGGTLRLDIPVTAVITDLEGNPLAGLPYTSGESFTVYKAPPPTVVSSIRADPNPTNAASVNFIVTFSEAVNGVGADDFSLFTTGSISDASVTNVSGSGAIYTVNVNTGAGSGTLRLDVPATATVTNLAGYPLAGLPYTSGEAYTVVVMIFLPLILIFTS